MKKITHCRACGSAALTPAFSLSKIAPAGQRRGLIGRRAAPPSADYVLCDPTRDAGACGLLQNAYVDDAPRRRSAPSAAYRATRSSLRSLATEALELISGRECAALDIGCSDGTLLSFYPRWVDRFGVDPADAVDDIGAWAWSAKAAFPSADIDRAFAGKKFDVITAASVLEEIDEPRAFFARVKTLLVRDGVFALETLYAPITLTRTGVDAFAGGVAAVYSLAAIERALRDCELKIFRGALTDKDGGSIRLFITHADAADYDFDPWFERLAQLWDEENALALRMIQPYQAFERRADEAREAFAALMQSIAAKGETVHIAGAPTDAAMLYAWAGGGAGVIEAAIAAAPEDEGARLGADGPVFVKEAESRDAEPDYILAAAPLKRELLERWRDPLLRGMKMIFATPTPLIVHAGNYAAEFGKSLARGDGAGGADTLRSILSAAGGLRVVADRGDRKSA